MKKQKITLTFRVVKEYQLDLIVDTPDDCCCEGETRRLLEEELDWLEEVNSQHSSISIDRHSRVVRHRIRCVKHQSDEDFEAGDLTEFPIE